MTALVRRVVDDSDLVEMSPHYAKNIITGFARMNGMPGASPRAPLAPGGLRDRTLASGLP